MNFLLLIRPSLKMEKNSSHCNKDVWEHHPAGEWMKDDFTYDRFYPFIFWVYFVIYVSYSPRYCQREKHLSDPFHNLQRIFV